MTEFHALLAWLFTTTHHPPLLIALAGLRLLGVVTLLLAGNVSRRGADEGCGWSMTLTAGFYTLAALQLIGALAMELPGAPLPNGWIFLFNAAVLVIGLAYYLKHVHAMRVPGGSCDQQ